MKHQPRILIVEDESSIAELIAVNLRHNGMAPVWAEDGDSAQRDAGRRAARARQQPAGECADGQAAGKGDEANGHAGWSVMR